MSQRARLALILLLAILLPGCSGSGLTEIHGTVTLDGTAIENGTIRFEADDGKTPSAQGVIKDGKYRAQVAPGKKKVEIQGYKVVGQRKRDPNDPSAPLEDVTEPIVPPAHTKHSCEIVSGKDTYDFPIKTK